MAKSYIEYSVKNTFITTVVPTDGQQTRRSKSVPRSFKPEEFMEIIPSGDACMTASSSNEYNSQD